MPFYEACRSKERKKEKYGGKERERERRKSETSHRHCACCSSLFVERQRTRNNFSEGTPRPVHVGIELPPAFRYPVSRAWSAIRESFFLPARLVPPRVRLLFDARMNLGKY